jgi:hypothetical protein
MRADEPDPVEAIVSAILIHLESHPRAADSAEGVARWWLRPTQVGVTVEQVERALNCLVARGTMRRSQLIDGTFLYSEVTATRQ